MSSGYTPGKTYTARQIAERGWTTYARRAGDGTGYFTNEEISQALLDLQYRAQQRTNQLLEQIIALLNGLGADGLHTILRHHRDQITGAKSREQLAQIERNKARARKAAETRRHNKAARAALVLPDGVHTP